MKLENKKALVARSLNVGKGRVLFNTSRLSEIKEAITKQDIRDLMSQGVILIKDKKGRRKVQKRKTRRRAGSVKKKVKRDKKEYMVLTRKLRKHLASLSSQEKISKEEQAMLRKEIRASSFRSLSHLKERVAKMKEAK